MEHQIVQFWNSSTSKNATLNSATLKATTLNSDASLITKEIVLVISIIAVVMCCFTTAQQSVHYVAQ